MKETLGEYIRREYMKQSKNNINLSAMDFELTIRAAVEWQQEQEKYKYQNINRVEVIDYSKQGRTYTNSSIRGVEIALQDNDETLKVFIK
jgi:hypothetical protein